MSTLQQIREDCYSFLEETSDNTHITPQVMNSFINRAQEMTAVLSESVKDSVEWVVEKGVGAYTLPSDNLLISSAYFGDKDKKNDLKPIDIFTEESLKSIHPFWLDETTDSEGQPTKLLWLDRLTVFLFPRPNTEFSTNKKLVVYYIFNPASLTQDSQSPNLHLVYHQVLKFYALYLCYMKLKNEKMSTKFYQDWIKHYEIVKGILSKGAEELFRWKWNFVEE